MRSILVHLTLIMIIFSPVVVGDTATPTMPSVLPKSPTVAANAFILVDYDSGKVLAENNCDVQVEPASLTKMMAMYVVDHEIKVGKLKLSDQILISKNAWQAPGSRMFVQVGTTVGVEDLIKGVIIQSGNDASVALAEHIAGSEQSFADMMNAYAKSLGMEHSHFVNTTGLPDKSHVTTARDLSILARAMIKNFPETYRIYSQKEFVYNGIKQHNRNQLLWRNPAVDGIKTGFTDNAGYCLVASGKVNNMRLIAVVLGSKSPSVRTAEANKLLTWGFRFYETNLVQLAGTKLQETKVWMGKSKHLDVGFNEDLYLTSSQGQYKNYTATVTLTPFLKAPIKKGDVVGTYLIQDKHNNTIIERPIVALSDIEKGNFLQRTRDYISLNIKAFMTKITS